MSGIALGTCLAAVLWWTLTGLLLVLDGLPPRTFRLTLAAATLVGAGGAWLVHAEREAAGAAAAIGSVAGALLVWGWVELTFLLGVVTGPRREACPRDCGGAGHVWHAIEAIAYHEVLLALGAALVVALDWGQPNPYGAYAYVALWAMRTSAKLNLHFGVRNPGDEFLPPHLAYLKSFFRRRPMNLLFPLSVTVPTLVAAHCYGLATAATASPLESTGWSMLGALLALGVLEHWLLVIPFPTQALWWFGVKPGAARGPAGSRDPAAPREHPACEVSPWQPSTR
ncbi:MAG: DUF3623 domain-containing protein [Proteobacteria bacterium]|nr:DUF3623 domain-containing protein [Pseudomonadota bacterium]